MDQSFDMVGYYAELMYHSKQYQNAGQPVPGEIVQQMQQLETRARATLSAEQFAQATQHVNQEVDRITSSQQENMQAYNEQEFGREVDNLAADIGQGLVGENISPVQYRQVVDGVETLTIDNTSKITHDPKPADTNMVATTKQFDSAGKGWTTAEYMKRMDALNDARLSGSEKRFQDELAKYEKIDPAELEQLVKDHEGQALEYEWKVRLAKNDKEGEVPDTYEVHVDDKTGRRAKLTDTYLEQTENDNNAANSFYDNIPADMLEDRGMTGDVARALAFHEETGAEYA